MQADTPPSSSILHRTWYPVVCATYPVWALAQANAGEMSLADAVRPLIAAVLVAGTLWALAKGIYRDSGKAGAATLLLLWAIFGYNAYAASQWQIILVVIGVGATLIAIGWSRVNWRAIGPALNFGAIVLVALPLSSIFVHALRSQAVDIDVGVATPGAELTDTQRAMVGSTPNVYVLILDGYGRDDILKTLYGYDNSEFTRSLEALGFYVADKARSNYPTTTLSLASSLNFLHLTPFIDEHGLRTGKNMRPLLHLIEKNRVLYLLKQFGYESYGYRTTLSRWSFFGTDHVERPDTFLNDFEYALIGKTPFIHLVYYLTFTNGNRLHYNAVNRMLDGMHASLEAPGPKVVLGHIVCPHPPFVFDREGNFRMPAGGPNLAMWDADLAVGKSMTAEEYRSQYIDQVAWLNGEVLRWAERARAEDPEAIIIIQGDHGPASMTRFFDLEKTNMVERFSILNAVRLPGDGNYSLYPELTPVNTFRIIANLHFGMNWELLPDTSHFPDTTPLNLVEIRFEMEGDHLNHRPMRSRDSPAPKQ